MLQEGIYALGGVVLASGYAGTWIYGIIERALIPFGLHHVFYMPFWQTGVGGEMLVDGSLIQGAQNIFLHSWLLRIQQSFQLRLQDLWQVSSPS